MNIGLVARNDPVRLADWVLHKKMAPEKMLAAEAEEAIQVLERLGPSKGLELGNAADPFAAEGSPW